MNHITLLFITIYFVTVLLIITILNVIQGQKVHKGDLLLTFDDELIKKNNLSDVVTVTILNTAELKDFEVLKNVGSQVNTGDDLFKDEM